MGACGAPSLTPPPAAQEATLQHAQFVVGQLVTILQVVALHPSNPTFYHFLFECVAVVVRACVRASPGELRPTRFVGVVLLVLVLLVLLFVEGVDVAIVVVCGYSSKRWRLVQCF